MNTMNTLSMYLIPYVAKEGGQSKGYHCFWTTSIRYRGQQVYQCILMLKGKCVCWKMHTWTNCDDRNTTSFSHYSLIILSLWSMAWNSIQRRVVSHASTWWPWCTRWNDRIMIPGFSYPYLVSWVLLCWTSKTASLWAFPPHQADTSW